MLNYVSEKLKSADLVLVGLGEDMDLLKTVKNESQYLQLKEKTQDEWILSLAQRQLMVQLRDTVLPMYRDLEGCIRDKNYFVVSLCQDGVIDQMELKPDRIVKPCGGFEKLQCPEGCTKELYDVPEQAIESIQAFMAGEISEAQVERAKCPVCGKELVFNQVTAPNYVEDGYLPQWNIYTKWLQGTVNKNLCILELGMGMKYPTVARWPFEKITFFNQKAELFRVHDRLYQITEEIKDRGHGFDQNPSDFLKELFNQN